jgi:transcriptional regulator with XRE-family HTH domain
MQANHPRRSVPEEDVEARVRRRLRSLRTALGLSLAEVAERASMDVSTLSRLETGQRRLALDHLPVLAAALGVSADALVGPTTTPDPRIVAEAVRMDGLTLWPLTNRATTAAATAYKVLVDPRRSEPPEPLGVHDGYDWMYVLHGRLRLVLGDQDLVVDPGEAVEFDTLTPHWFGAVDGPVELLAIFGPHGERFHLRATPAPG